MTVGVWWVWDCLLSPEFDLLPSRYIACVVVGLAGFVAASAGCHELRGEGVIEVAAKGAALVLGHVGFAHVVYEFLEGESWKGTWGSGNFIPIFEQPRDGVDGK